MNAKKLSALVVEHMFITMSGLAALAHSMWTIDVFFAGQETSFDADPFGAIFRKVIAFFIAAAIDIGQIYTSVEIKHGQRSKSKYATFGFFALCTYILQYLYMAYHTPHLELSVGIRPEWVPIVKFISDSSIWVIPALLPASTLLYTLSQNGVEHQQEAEALKAKMHEMEQAFVNEMGAREQEYLIRIEDMRREAAKQVGSNVGSPMLLPSGSYRIACPECAWEKDGYLDGVSAENGLRSHKPYCKKTRVSVQ